jgi:predicted RNA-binding protein with PUA-like domain
MWDGVRSLQARNNLAAMRKGDRVMPLAKAASDRIVALGKR